MSDELEFVTFERDNALREVDRLEARNMELSEQQREQTERLSRFQAIRYTHICVTKLDPDGTPTGDPPTILAYPEGSLAVEVWLNPTSRAPGQAIINTTLGVPRKDP